MQVDSEAISNMKTEKEIWTLRKSVLAELSALEDALNTNEGVRGKSPEEIGKMLERTSYLQELANSCRYELLKRQGRLGVL